VTGLPSSQADTLVGEDEDIVFCFGPKT